MKADRYAKHQAENDAKALDSLARYSKKAIPKKIDTVPQELEIMREMLLAITANELDYAEVKPMILYVAHRDEAFNEYLLNELDDVFVQKFADTIDTFVKMDPDLEHDIEVACDPMWFGK